MQDSSNIITGPLADNIVAQVESLGAATARLEVRKREAQLAARARGRATANEIRGSPGTPMKALLEMTSEKAGKLADPYEDIASPCTRLPFRMVSALNKAGQLSGYHRYLSVVALFRWTMR